MISDERRVEWRRQITLLLKLHDQLTDWEKDFVKSIDRWVNAEGCLTFKQSSTLRKIFNKAAGGL